MLLTTNAWMWWKELVYYCEKPLYPYMIPCTNSLRHAIIFMSFDVHPGIDLIIDSRDK